MSRSTGFTMLKASIIISSQLVNFVMQIWRLLSRILHVLLEIFRVASINGKKYILVIVDDYSRYTWNLFLRSKDETPKVLKDFLTMIQRNLQASVITVRTDRGTEFMNKTLNAFFKEERIEHQTLTARTPKQNGVVERRNRTLVEVARTMPSAVGNKMHKAFPLPGESSHWQYKFPLPVEGVPTTRRMEIPLPGVCTAMMKKLPVKDKWQLY
nr:putative ribonuclease H-like domain-containing protein [Tanacetum cinerariifolium]